MYKVYPVGIGALILLSGCSSFLGGRFAGPSGNGRVGCIRRGTACASTVHMAMPVPGSTPMTTMARGCEHIPVVPSVDNGSPKVVHIAKSEAQRLLPEPTEPAAVAVEPAAPASRPEVKRASIPALIPSDLAAEASEDNSVDRMPEGARPGSVDDEGPRLRYLHNRRMRLEYEVQGAGPSGVSGVELWFTRDGRQWARADTLTQQPPYVVDFGEEGRFGVTLVARNGVGVGQAAPVEGEKPQAWVEIDTTKPDVILSEVKFDPNTRVVNIAWSASDRNLDPRSVCLSYATEPEGPWSPIARNVDNLGKYGWKADEDEGQRLYVRVEVMDLAGNIGTARSQEPLVLDLSRPTARITRLEEAP